MFALVAAAILLQSPAPVQPSTNRGQTFDTGIVEDNYDHRWAVIIGANYDDKGKKWQLKNAESDAQSLHKILTDCYGYEKENIQFFLGKEKNEGRGSEAATEDALRSTFDNAFLTHPDKIKANDSLIVYFSGHGYLVANEAKSHRKTGHIFPADFRALDDKDETPNTGSTIKISDIVEGMRDCKARHKLLILDCCHSGVVFQIEVGMRGARLGGSSKDLFREPAFQAISAGLESQLVPDGRAGDHSPFTKALLRGLTTIPQRSLAGPGQYNRFAASELFTKVRGDILAVRTASQTPDYGWIGEQSQGEFFFIPSLRTGQTWPSEGRLDVDQQKQLLAIVPSTLGQWWADEMLWFMPALRDEIIRHDPKTRSTEVYFNVDAIRNVAREKLMSRNRNDVDGATKSGFTYHYDHLEKLLGAQGMDQQVLAIDSVIKDLEKRYKDKLSGPPPAKIDPESLTDANLSSEPEARIKALDLHYLAVLYHKRKRSTEAETCYLHALAAYLKVPDVKPLLALCFTDYGILCLNNLANFQEAMKQFRFARSAAGVKAPVPFEVFTLCREADAARRLGMFEMSDSRMTTARDRMIGIDPANEHPITGAVLKYDGYACMEQCRFDEARERFEASKRVFEKLAESMSANAFPYKIELFHISHGLAMINRFQGRDEETVKQFRELNDNIVNAIRELDSRTDDPLENTTEIRQLLCERYVNSLDRQGDCRLFGRFRDYAEAADDYRKALRAVSYIPEDRRDTTSLDLQYRRAIALSLPSPAQNFILADQICEEAEKLELYLIANKGLKSLPEKTRINKIIARTLARSPTELSDNELWALVHADNQGGRIESTNAATTDRTRVSRSSRSLDRDEVERLMFGCVLLLQHRNSWGLSDLNALECCDHLLSACRMATRSSLLKNRGDQGLLTYLRPYYDIAFRFKAEQAVIPVKELIEIAWESTRGGSYHKPKTLTPILVLYRVKTGASMQGYLLLDVPAMENQSPISKCVMLSDEWNDEALLRDASRSDTKLPIPTELTKEFEGLLKAIQADTIDAKLPTSAEESSVSKDSKTPTVRDVSRGIIRWRDPVTRLGLVKAESTNNKKITSFSVSEDAGLEGKFPFKCIPLFTDDSESEEFKIAAKQIERTSDSTVFAPRRSALVK